MMLANSVDFFVDDRAMVTAPAVVLSLLYPRYVDLRSKYVAEYAMIKEFGVSLFFAQHIGPYLCAWC